MTVWTGSKLDVPMCVCVCVCVCVRVCMCMCNALVEDTKILLALNNIITVMVRPLEFVFAEEASCHVILHFH